MNCLAIAQYYAKRCPVSDPVELAKDLEAEARIAVWLASTQGQSKKSYSRAIGAIRHYLRDDARMIRVPAYQQERRYRLDNIPTVGLMPSLPETPQEEHQYEQVLGVLWMEDVIAHAELTLRQQRVLRLCIFGGLSHRVTAVRLRISEVTVSREVESTKKKLRLAVNKVEV